MAWRRGVHLPGDIPQSGRFAGRTEVEGWFRGFFAQFPKIRFDVHDICVRSLFDLVGTNVVAVHWDIHLTNREGKNSGVTAITIERGKVVGAKDYIFDLGENCCRNCGAA